MAADRGQGKQVEKKSASASAADGNEPIMDTREQRPLTYLDHMCCMSISVCARAAQSDSQLRTLRPLQKHCTKHVQKKRKKTANFHAVASPDNAPFSLCSIRKINKLPPVATNYSRGCDISP